MVSNTTADALLHLVLHEEAHDISFLVVMPPIGCRGKRHRLTCSTRFRHGSMPSAECVCELASGAPVVAGVAAYNVDGKVRVSTIAGLLSPATAAGLQ